MDHASIKDESLHSWSGLEWDNSRDALRIDSQILQTHTHTHALPQQAISFQAVVSLLFGCARRWFQHNAKPKHPSKQQPLMKKLRLSSSVSPPSFKVLLLHLGASLCSEGQGGVETCGGTAGAQHLHVIRGP